LSDAGGWPVWRGPRSGVVEAFDAERGVGTIAAAGASFFFHCTALTDGSREVEVGREVLFVVRPAHGRLEATSVVKR
jgi:cold shock CspA family protein